MRPIINFLIVLLLFVSSGQLLAQQKRKGGYNQQPDKKSLFLKTQWWLGFYGGVNLSRVMPGETFSAIEPLNYNEATNGKSYESFQLPSGVAGIDVTFYHQGFSFSFKPNYRVNQFTYETTHQWQSESNPDYSLSLTYSHSHRLQYIDLPVLIRYDILSGNVRPFLHGGGYYSILLDATKTLGTTGEDMASGTSGEFNGEEVTVGATDMFSHSTYGIIAGVGCTYDVWNVRFLLEANYRIGMSEITAAGNRYNANPFTGIGDAMDNLTLQSIGVNIGCVFPLRFISKNLKAVE